MMTAALKLLDKLCSTAITEKELPDGWYQLGVEVWFNLDEVRELKRILASYDALQAALNQLVYLKDDLKHRARTNINASSHWHGKRRGRLLRWRKGRELSER